MGIREAMAKNPAGAAIVTVVVLVVAIWFVAVNRSPGPSYDLADQAYFYDLGSGKLFPGPRDAVSPIDAPVGGAGKGFRAHVFTCGKCSESELMIGYISKLTGEAAELAASDPEKATSPEAAAIRMQGEFVAAPPAPGAEPNWVLEASPKGEKLTSEATSKCGDRFAKPCRP